MKLKNDLSITYKGYLQQAWYNDAAGDMRDINALLAKFRMFNNPLLPCAPLFFVIDYTAGQYLAITDAVRQISGYHPQDFIATSLGSMVDAFFNKDDFAVYNQKIFANNTSFLKTTPHEEHRDYIFSYTFRFIRQDKKIANVWQRGSYITSAETGLPLYSLGMLMDLTHIKTDTAMVHTIEKVGMQNGRVSNQLVSRDYFYPDAEEGQLTRREKAVLQYLAEGYSSKQVAEKMFLSGHTIVSHKQNMLRKTNTKNIAQLVAFAITNRII